MTEAPVVTPPRDRIAGLVIFGVLQLLIGLACVAMTLMMAVVAERSAAPDMPRGSALAQALVVYAMAAVYFIAAGAGSIRARRWARALTIVVSAMWAVMGIVSLIMFAIMIPRFTATLAEGQRVAVFGCAAGMFVVAGILVPLALFLFYRTDAVRETVERRDPVARWTDRVPLPVLAVVLVLGFTAVALLVSLSNPVLPLMGTVLTGAPAALTLLSLSFLCAFVAVQAYQLKESAWWTLVLLQVIGCVVGTLTFMRMDVTKVAEASGSPEFAQVYREPIFIATMIATWVGYFAFLVYLKRYFGRIVPRTRSSDTA